MSQDLSRLTPLTVGRAAPTGGSCDLRHLRQLCWSMTAKAPHILSATRPDRNPKGPRLFLEPRAIGAHGLVCGGRGKPPVPRGQAVFDREGQVLVGADLAPHLMMLRREL